MMKKVAMVVAAAAMVLPLGLGAIAPIDAGATTAYAATKKAATKTTLALVSRQAVKKTAYHAKSSKTALFSAAFAADQAKVTISQKGTLSAKKTVYATKKMVVKTPATKTAKAGTMTCVYVKSANGKTSGWVALGDLTKGAATMVAAKKTTPKKATAKKTMVKKSTKKATKKTTKKSIKATLVGKPVTIKKAAYHINGKAPVYYSCKATGKTSVLLTKKGTLPVSKTYYATKSITVKQGKKTVKYCYVTNNKTKGYVLATSLTKGKFLPAD